MLQVKIRGKMVHQKDSFKYLGSMIQTKGEVEDDIMHRIKAWWLKWICHGVLCNKKVPLKLKGKFYKVAIIRRISCGATVLPTVGPSRVLSFA